MKCVLSFLLPLTVVCVCVCVCVCSWCIVCMLRQEGKSALDLASSDAARGVIRAHMSVSSASQHSSRVA
jgi:hypothetical protein